MPALGEVAAGVVEVADGLGRSPPGWRGGGSRRAREGSRSMLYGRWVEMGEGKKIRRAFLSLYGSFYGLYSLDPNRVETKIWQRLKFSPLSRE